MIQLNGHFIGKVPSVLQVKEDIIFFSLPESIETISYVHVRKCVRLSLDNIYIRFGTKLLDKLWVL